MTARFNVNEVVYVPSSMLPEPDNYDAALVTTRINGLIDGGRSYRVNIQDADGHDVVVSSKRLVGNHLGIEVIRIGDLLTEENTLDPLSKSLLHFLRLLLRPSNLRLREVRTTVELQQIWRTHERATSHVVLIGHGATDSIRFLDESAPVTGEQLGELLERAAPTTVPKVFLSLSCLTGWAAFAGPFSESRVCADLLAPLQSVHSALASQFAQNFFASHLLGGHGVVAARNQARKASPPGASFRHWRAGKMQKLPASAS